MVFHSSGSEAIDTAHAQDLMLRLAVLEVPDTGMSAARRGRVWAQIAQVSEQLCEVAVALARSLAPESGGGVES